MSEPTPEEWIRPDPAKVPRVEPTLEEGGDDAEELERLRAENKAMLTAHISRALTATVQGTPSPAG